jgi:hypothetical protein
MNIINAGLRFLLELAALFAVGYWSWHLDIGAVRFILVVVGPVLFAAIWYTFNVRNDPSRSGKAPVPVPGFVRLSIELFLFALAVIAAFSSMSALIGIIFGLALLFHYVTSYKRFAWMVRN